MKLTQSFQNRYVSEEHKLQIEIMFYGPYLPEWKDAKGLVDNTDGTIAKRLGISKDTVRAVLVKSLNEHFNRIFNTQQPEKSVWPSKGIQ